MHATAGGMNVAMVGGVSGKRPADAAMCARRTRRSYRLLLLVGIPFRRNVAKLR